MMHGNSNIKSTDIHFPEPAIPASHRRTDQRVRPTAAGIGRQNLNVLFFCRRSCQ